MGDFRSFGTAPGAAAPLRAAAERLLAHLCEVCGIDSSPRLEVKAIEHASAYDPRDDLIYIAVPDGARPEDLWPLPSQLGSWAGLQLEMVEEFAHALTGRLERDSASPEAIELADELEQHFEGPGHGHLFFEALSQVATSLFLQPDDLAHATAGVSLKAPDVLEAPTLRAEQVGPVSASSPPDEPRAPQQRNILAEVRAMSRFVEACQDWFGEVSGDAQPASPGAQDIAALGERDAIQALAQARLLSLVVRDHLECLCRSLAEPALTIAPWSCARSVIEASAIGCWLLDPKIDASERAIRSLSFRQDGVSRQVVLGRKTGRAAETERSSQRLTHLEEQMEGLNAGERNRKIPRMPRITDLVHEALDDANSYRILSAMVHAQPWAVVQLGLVPAETPDSASGEEDGSRWFGKGIPAVAVKFLCLKSGEAFHELNDRLAKYIGEDRSELERFFQQFLSRVT